MYSFAFLRCFCCCYADLHPSVCFLHQAGEEGAHEISAEDRGKKVLSYHLNKFWSYYVAYLKIMGVFFFFFLCPAGCPVPGQWIYCYVRFHESDHPGLDPCWRRYSGHGQWSLKGSVSDKRAGLVSWATVQFFVVPVFITTTTNGKRQRQNLLLF